MMRRILQAIVLMMASVTASGALAAMSAVNPAFTQNLDARPKKGVLLSPQVSVFELSAGGVLIRVADRAYVEYYLTLIKTQNPIDNGT